MITNCGHQTDTAFLSQKGLLCPFCTISKIKPSKSKDRGLTANSTIPEQRPVRHRISKEERAVALKQFRPRLPDYPGDKLIKLVKGYTR